MALSPLNLPTWSNLANVSEQAIQAATTVAAEIIGWHDRIGSIERSLRTSSPVSGETLKEKKGRYVLERVNS